MIGNFIKRGLPILNINLTKTQIFAITMVIISIMIIAEYENVCGNRLSKEKCYSGK